MSKKYKKKKKSLVEYLRENGFDLDELTDEKQIIIDGIKTDYTITRQGDVKSYKFVNTNEPRVLKPIQLDNGYFAVNIMIGKNEKLIHIHKLVADNFIINDDPVNKVQINHKDGDKSHNYESNLEWVTAQENIEHAVKTGLKKGKQGVEHHAASLTEKDVINICELLIENKMTYKEIAEKVGTTYTVVKKIKNKQRWKHLTEKYDFSNYIPEKKRRKNMSNKIEKSTNENKVY